MAIAQLAGGIDAINARSVADRALQAAYASQPGGTPETNLWQTLVLMGVDDNAPTAWDGNVKVASGELFDLQGYRFELPDRVLPGGSWRMQTRLEKILASSPIEGSGVSETRILPKGLLLLGSGVDATSVAVETNHGRCSFSPLRLAFGVVDKCLNGVEVKRIPAATDLSGTELRQHDFPALGADNDTGRDAAVWAAWLSSHEGHEELNFRRYRDGKWTRLIPVPHASEDLWRPQVATDDNGAPWLIWSQQSAGNWDLWAMTWDDRTPAWGVPQRLTADVFPDIEPHVARGPDGAIYVVWQALAGATSQIRLKYLKQGKWSETIPVSSSAFNDWQPAVAAGKDGRVWIAWDRYIESYDVFCRSYKPGAGFSPEMKVAATPRFEAYPTVAVDRQDRPWIAWEVGGMNWGKDLGAALGETSPGQPLGGPRRLEVVCLDNRTWKAPAPFAFKDALGAGSLSESDPLLFVDPNGNLWLSFKRRFSRIAYRPSTFWETYLTRLDGDRWTEPMPLPKSWTRKSTRMGLAAADGRLWAFWPSESREWVFASRPRASRVVAGSITLPPRGREPGLTNWQAASTPALSVHPQESDVAAVRAHRVKVGSESLRIVRGDLHRHSELSQDVGGLDDGSLPEFYRYMIDVAAMDFGASTDHQGGGTDYWNVMTQKMADMYHFPERFVTLYAYERNMGNPFGHRNIIHTRRNYAIVPFFQRPDPKFMLPDSPDGELLTFNSMSFGGAVANDTKLLYDELRKTGGLAIPHTSATDSMGTDWRDNDPKLDPVLEIYQGARQNYEHKNAPRGIRDGEESKALGGFQEAGLVWNAWKKGYRIGVIASSDHYSTHISYAMVYTPAADRKSIFDSILKRHTYGATDNIVLEFWLGSHFMGDDFASRARQPIRVKARGTGEIAAIHLIRDAKYVYKVAPGSAHADFEYRDNDVGPGDHWYYVRLEQQNGELAWSSPIWVRYE